MKRVLPIKIHHHLIEVHSDGLMRMQHDGKWCSEFENGQMGIHADGCVVGTGQASTSDDRCECSMSAQLILGH